MATNKTFQEICLRLLQVKLLGEAGYKYDHHHQHQHHLHDHDDDDDDLLMGLKSCDNIFLKKPTSLTSKCDFISLVSTLQWFHNHG